MMRQLLGIAASAVFAVSGVLLSHAVFAQGWSPQRNAELIVPAGAGGSLDTTGRTVHRVWDELKLVPVTSTIVNRSGGGHAVAYSFLNQRAGDPHYLSITSATILTNHINGRLPVTYTDFTMLAVLLTEYVGFAVRSESPIKSGKDLVEVLKINPAALTIALSSAAGGTHHITVGMPLQSGGVDMSGALASGPTWPALGYKGVFEYWRGVIGTRGMTAQQSAYWEGVLRSVVQSDDFKKYAEKNQWDDTFKGSAEMRKFLEAQYGELKGVMSFLGLST